MKVILNIRKLKEVNSSESVRQDRLETLFANVDSHTWYRFVIDKVAELGTVLITVCFATLAETIEESIDFLPCEQVAQHCRDTELAI